MKQCKTLVRDLLVEMGSTRSIYDRDISLIELNEDEIIEVHVDDKEIK